VKRGKASRYNRRIRIERKVRPVGRGNAGQETWALVGEAWAEVQDMLPSRGERLSEGMTMAARPARIRMRYRTDITSDMRIIYGARVMQITAGPAELGHREEIELMAENYSTAGVGA
jgi:SPP1 family predicted phage head-tail adaptor